MQLIEPCCTPKHLLAIRSKLGENGTCFWHGFGDLSIAELLPHMLTRYSNVDITIVAPALPNEAAEVVRQMMENQRTTVDGQGKIHTIKHLTLLADLRKKKSPDANAWLADNPFGERLTLCNVQQNDTCIILPDIAFFGNINLSYNGHFTAVATKNARLMADLRKNYDDLQI